MAGHTAPAVFAQVEWDWTEALTLAVIPQNPVKRIAERGRNTELQAAREACEQAAAHDAPALVVTGGGQVLEVLQTGGRELRGPGRARQPGAAQVLDVERRGGGGHAVTTRMPSSSKAG